MRAGDVFEEAFRSISTNKARSGLTMLGIVIGIASVIALVALGQGSTSSITSRIESMGSNLLTVRPGFSRNAGIVRISRGAGQTLTPKDAEAITQLGSEIAAISPELEGRYQVVADAGNVNTQVLSILPAYAPVHNIQMAEGSFVDDQQATAVSRVAVLGSTAATDLFGDPAAGGVDPIGQTIRIKNQKFTVIGVAQSKGGNGFNSPDEAIYVPLATGQRLLAGQTKYVSAISVQAASQKVMTQAQNDITDLLLQQHRISDPNQADFTVINQADLVQTVSSVSRTLTLLLAAVAGISLIVGGIGIMNMMLTTVTERTREIGLRKAVGAKRLDISLQFLIEAVVLTFTGGIVGILLGWLTATMIARFGNMTSQVTVVAVALAFGVSALIGIVFGFYPARRASGLNPIDALRHE
ncbi:MAG: ABC transporter permease [Actinobacteria bacterium]|nr:ABC transporter permease [Actinomycetota bacterium]